MSTKITIWGTHGRIYADRQECQVYLREVPESLQGFQIGWNVRYTTDLTDPVWFYLRGEEYSAQLDYFVQSIKDCNFENNVNSFSAAVETDRVISMMIADAEQASGFAGASKPVVAKQKKGLMTKLFGR